MSAPLVTRAEAIAALATYGSQEKAAKALGIGRMTLRRALERKARQPSRSVAKLDIAEGIDRNVADKLHKLVRGASKARYVITAAQNATPVHTGFLASLKGYCRARKATLLVIPLRYKNPTSVWSAKAVTDDWWDARLVPHLIDRRVDLAPGLTLLADIKTQPTASSPLQGFETMTGASSGILGHPKLELTTVATPQSRLPKILTTTGVITTKNYTASKAGKKGEHHHTFGACVVEVADGLFHLRQINAMSDGSFCDLDKEYAGDEIRAAEIAALVMGDSHIEVIDPKVVKATFKGKDSIIGALKPKKVVFHDLHDFQSRNHHNDVMVRHVLHREGRDNVERGLDETFAFVDSVTGPGVTNIFVASNHPDALGRWVRETDPRTDPENAVFWAKTFQAMIEGSRMLPGGASTPDPFYYWAAKKLKTIKQSVFLRRDQTYLIAGIDVSNHGDAGPNGARGSRAAFGKVGVRSVIGHSHSPGIKDGVYQVGTSSLLRLGYNRGPSSWLNTHCLIYKSGKRSLVNIIDGRWRA